MVDSIALRQGPSGPKLDSGPAGNVVTSLGGGLFASRPASTVIPFSPDVPTVTGLGLGTAGASALVRDGGCIPELPYYRFENDSELLTLFPPVGNVVTLTHGRYVCAGLIDLPPGVRVVGPPDQFVDWSIERVPFGLRGAVDGSGALLDLSRGPINGGPMTITNTGTAAALRVSTSPEFRLNGWSVVGETLIESQTVITGGNYGTFSFRGGDRLRISNAFLERVVLTSLAGDSARGVWMNTCVQNGSVDVFCDCPDGQTLLHGFFLVNCESDGPLVRTGINVNIGATVGATTPFVGVQNCRCNAAAGGVEVRNGTIFPAGGLVVMGNHFAAAAPFGFADPQDALFYSRGNFGAGVKLTETTIVP